MKIIKICILGLTLTLLTIAGNKIYAAERQTLVSLSFENADIRTVLRTFSRLGNVNIVASEKVAGTITIQLAGVPWDRAFQTVLRVHGLTAVEDKDIIGVMTMEESKNQREIMGLETRILRVKYAKASKIESSISSMLTERGKAKTDERSNSLIITDVPEAIYRAEKLINEVDIPTPQVMIEAKIVEIDHKIVDQMGIAWKTGGIIPTGDINSSLAGEVKALTPLAGQVTFGTMLKDLSIGALITMLETQDKAHILSQPKIAVMDNEEAMILSGKKIPIITLDRAGNKLIEFYDVALKFTVTPHINPDNQIVLELHPEVSDISSEATSDQGIIILAQEAKTTLMVNNNQTAVIGGIIKEKTGKIVSGVPFLCRIPLLGRLFKSVADSKNTTDLIIFVTPTIIPIEKK
ncbi:MAG: secretin N-terminal domain-containing protein [bacterium]|nr:secretin N-terminal domain-containing protein [bacterium]